MRLRNRVTEKDLRTWLDHEGWFGRSAKVDSLELYAIKRPGWEQVFRFEIAAKRRPDQSDEPATNKPAPIEPTSTIGPESNIVDQQDSPVQLWGAIHDDERTKANKPSIWIYENEDKLLGKLDKLSEDMIVLRHGQTSTDMLPLLIILAVAIITVGFAKFFFQ